MGQPYVIVYRGFDPVVCDHLGDILRDNGIAARVLGTRSGALVGAGQSIMQLNISVPSSQAGEATDFLEAYFAHDGEELLANEGVFDEPEDGSKSESDHGGDGDESTSGEPEPVRVSLPMAPSTADDAPLRPLFAAGAAFFLFGFGFAHIYTRRAATAVVLIGGWLVAVKYLLAGRYDWDFVVIGTTMLVVLLLAELIAGQLAVRAYNRGDRPGLARQLVAGMVIVGIALGLGHFLGPRIDQPEDSQYWHDTPVAPAGH